MQLASRFLTLGILKRQGVAVLDAGAFWPAVCVLKHMPKDGCRSKPNLGPRARSLSRLAVSPVSVGRRFKMPLRSECSHLFIDEAHHSEAPTWIAFRDRFAARRVLQFTATPFREDGKPLDGKLIYVYPLRKAQEDGYFRPIRFVKVVEFDPSRADEAIAAAAIEQLRADADRGHVLMARVETVKPRSGGISDLRTIRRIPSRTTPHRHICPRT